MLTPVYSARFKKDFKLAQKRGLNVKSLLAVMEQLQNQELLDERLYTHRLTGNYAGYFECHISPDWLLVYLPDEAQNEIYFARTGSHSDLF